MHEHSTSDSGAVGGDDGVVGVEPVAATDSAGQPWAGRQFGETAFAGDDGSAPPALLDALARFRGGTVGEAAVVDALRECRLLIPLVAAVGEEGVNEAGVKVDKSADLSIVTVAGPDGRNVLPVFTSVAAMQHWNSLARPVPADAVRVALAAADEQTDLVVIDPTSTTEFVVRRPALWALAQSQPWTPCHQDAVVAAEFEGSIADEGSVQTFTLAAGDPKANLRGPELVVELALVAGLNEESLRTLLERLQARWSGSEIIAQRVDSLSVKLVAAP